MAKPLLQGRLQKSSNKNSKRHNEKASSVYVFASKQFFQHLCQFVVGEKILYAVRHSLPALLRPLIAAFHFISNVNIQTLCTSSSEGMRASDQPEFLVMA